MGIEWKLMEIDDSPIAIAWGCKTLKAVGRRRGNGGRAGRGASRSRW